MRKPLSDNPGNFCATPRGLAANAGRAPGFTLVEVLVAIGAVALITVGLAAIFNSVGKTVTGGRRASQFSVLASAIEDQFRRDFANITREGPLVIRQQYANRDQNTDVDPFIPPANGNPDAVALFAGEPAAARRARRVDEIVFFVRGDFATTRTTMLDGVVARADSARVYYGHGQRRREDDLGNFAGNNSFVAIYPDPHDPNATNTGWNPAEARQLGVAGSPNEFASDWTLLRHATLLVSPRVSLDNREAAATANQTYFNSAPDQAFDRDAQIACQPAATSVFRHWAMYLPGTNQPDDPGASNAQSLYVRPRPNQMGSTYRSAPAGGPIFASGVVDIATTSLSEVRSVITNGIGNFDDPSPRFTNPEQRHLPNYREWPADLTGDPLQQTTQLRTFEIANAQRYLVARPTGRDVVVRGPNVADAVDMAHAWMNDLFPTESSYDPDPLFRANPSGAASEEAYGVRMRYEPEPPGILEVFDAGGNAIPSINSSLPAGSVLSARARRGDQAAIIGSNFIPRCSEFIVEWSFGEISAEGELIWHGLERRAETDGVAGITTNDTRILATPYPPVDAAGDPVWHSVRYRNARPSDLSKPWLENAYRFPNYPPILVPEFGEYRVSDRLIYGYQLKPYNNSPAAPTTAVSSLSRMTSFFGIVDPTFNPAKPHFRYLGTPNPETDFAVDAIEALDANTGQIIPFSFECVAPAGQQVPAPEADCTDLRDAFDSADPTLPWAWPRFVRITMTIAANPRERRADVRSEDWIEETYQYIFTLPADAAPDARN